MIESSVRLSDGSDLFSLPDKLAAGEWTKERGQAELHLIELDILGYQRRLAGLRQLSREFGSLSVDTISQYAEDRS